MSSWFQIQNPDDVSSPALLVYPDRIEENIRRMVRMTGNVERLRPHIKTHKTAEIVRLHLKVGINKFKCATIAEAELAATAGAKDILLAYQPVGPNIGRLLTLVRNFPAVRFSCIADNAKSLRELSEVTTTAAVRVEVLLDLDVGQHRTGVAPDSAAYELYRLLTTLPGLVAGGLHAYDGHIHDSDAAERSRACEAAFAPVEMLRGTLERDGFPVPRIVAGGTPTFPTHAQRENVECSPGTCVFWDAGYARNFPDLDFLSAAMLFTRIISKPAPTHVCLDLGHKAVASEMSHPRLVFPDFSDAIPVMHNEEHLVMETPRAHSLAVGDGLYAIPWHICPTVALHAELVIVRNGRAEERWKVAARDRALTI